MKLKTLLVLVASMMMTFAYAERQKPAAPAGVDPVSGEKYYIMNVEAGQYLDGAKVWFSWATSSGLTDGGQLSTLTEEEGKWTIQRADGKYTFISGPAAGRGEMHVDGGSSTQWNFTKQANGTYRINVDASDATYGESYAGKYWGWEGYNGSPANAIVANLDPEKAHCEWIFVNEDGHETFKAVQADYQNQMKCYYTAINLDAAIKEALAAYPSLDLAAEQAVYANDAATLKEIEEAIASVGTKKAVAVAEEAMSKATLDNPIDMTASIVNSTFDKVGDFTGWSGSGFGAGGTTSTCAERFQMVFNTYQDIKNLPIGVYKVNVDGFYRAGSIAEDLAAEQAQNKFNAKVYGANILDKDSLADFASASIMHLFHGIPEGEHFDIDGVTIGGTNSASEAPAYWIPNSMLDFTNYNGTTKNLAEPFYKTNSVLACTSTGTLRIGVKNDSSTGWQIFDNFGLTYYGNGADAWGALMANYKENCTIEEGLTVTVSVKEAYENAVSSAEANSYETYKASADAIAIAMDSVKANSAKWAEYIALATKAGKLLEDPKYAEVATDLSDYLNYDYSSFVEALELTSVEIDAEIANLNNLYEEAKALTPAGTDVTSMITNPQFANSWTGWEHKGTGGNVAANASAKCAEAWNSANFDIHQDITNAPVGLYEVKVQGFYRYLRGDNAWKEYFDESTGEKKAEPIEHIKNTPAMIYCNDNTAPMANVFDYSVEKDYATAEWQSGFYTDPLQVNAYPDNMPTAGKMFDMKDESGKPYYQVSTFGVVAEKGDVLRIGMKGNSNQGGDSWAIFTRFELVYQGFDAALIKPELEKIIANMDMAKSMGSDVKAEADAAVENGNAALAQEDGKVMFDALAKLLAVKGKVAESVALFEELVAKNGELGDKIGNSEEAFEDVIQAAAVLNAAVNEGVEGATYTNEDATKALADIKAIMNKLSIPATIADASIADPVDLTSFIENPSFETGNTNGWTNLSGTGTQAFGAQSNTAFGKTGTYYAEGWHAAGNLDMNQVVENLPCGTYVIAVDAHASCGGYLYANNDSVAITNVDDSTSPSNDKVCVYIEEGQTIKIGVKGTLTGNTWFCVDNFTLSCIGYMKNVKAEWGGIDAIDEINVKPTAKKSIFTINGAQTNALTKGINIIRLSNGKVVKVMVK